MKTEPSAEQLQALRRFAREHGRYWKMALRHAWIRDERNPDPLLRQLRNNFGPKWLRNFRLETKK